MPYIILTANGEELDRANLSGPPLTIGRSPECDVSVRDVLMSRRHCRVEPATGKERGGGGGGRWKFVDLGSRNGSHVNWKKVTTHTLVDGDTVRVGRTWLTFRSGAFTPAPQTATASKRKQRLVRPADPHDALSGTVADFVYAEPDQGSEEFDATPSPQGPRGSNGGGGGATISSPLEELSTSWGSIVATSAARPKRMARPIPRPRDTDLSLQALPQQVPYLEVVPQLPRRRRNLMPAMILALGISLATAVVLLSGWMMTRS